MSIFGTTMRSLAQIAEEVGDEALGVAGQGFSAYLQQQTKIRIFVDNTPGSGHQSTTVHILMRLIFGFRYPGAVEVVYDSRRGKDGKFTLNKLGHLIPGFDPANPVPIYIGPEDQGQANVTFIAFPFVNPANIDTVTLGFTGGVDPHKDEPEKDNLAVTVNAEFFLRLKPYLWTDGFNRVEQKNGETYPIGGLEELIFYAREYEPTEADWSWYQTHGASAVKKRVKTMHTIFKVVEEHSNLLFCPAYGISEAPATRVRPERLATTLIAGLLQWTQERQQSSVIVNYDNVLEKSTIDLKYLLAGGYTSREATAKRSGAFEPDPKKPKGIDWGVWDEYRALAQSWQDRSALLETLHANERVKVVWAAKEEDIRKLIVWASDKSGRVVFIQLGGLPRVLFDDMFSKSTLPMVFEGLGTAGLALNRGRPFLHMPRSQLPIKETGYVELGNESLAYPERIISVDGQPIDYSKEAEQCIDAGEFLVYGFQPRRPGSLSYDDTPFSDAVAHISDFLASAFGPASKGLARYFADIRQFYGRESKDRLLHGIAALLLRLPPLTRSALASATHLSLAELLTALYAHLDDNAQLNLVPGALPDNRIAEFIKQLLKEAPVDKFSVTQAEITPEQNPPSPVTQIEIHGQANFAGLQSAISILFTEVAGQLVCHIKLTPNIALDLNGAPWLAFDDATLELVLYEAPAPPECRVTAQPRAKPWPVQLRFPTPRGWVLSSDFEPADGPRISDFFQLCGGRNLLANLPMPESILQALRVRQFEMVYWPASNSLRSLSIGVGLLDDKEWALVGDVHAKNVHIVFRVIDPSKGTKAGFSAQLSAQAIIGAATLGLTARIPEFDIQGSIATTEDPLRLSELLHSVALDMPLDDQQDPQISDLSFAFSPRQTHFSVNTTLDLQWTPDFGGFKPITLENMSISAGRGGDFFGVLSGMFLIGHIEFGLSASYRSEQGWVFEGKQGQDPIKLKGLMEQFLPHPQTAMLASPRVQLNDVDINDLFVSIHTKEPSYAFAGTAQWHIDERLGVLKAKVSVRNEPAQDSNERVTSGSIAASWDFHGAALEVAYDFASGGDAITVNFLGATAKYTNEKIIFNLGDRSLGDMVRLMTGWADDGSGPLRPPWNILDSINFKSFDLIVDTNNRSIALEYPADRDLNLDLVFITVNKIQLIYQAAEAANSEEDSGVRIKLTTTGMNRLGDSEDDSWNLRDEGPATPGFGRDAFDLRLLGLGQHITIKDGDFNSVESVIEAIKNAPVPVGNDMPIKSSPSSGEPAFNTDSQWLIVSNFGLMKIGDGGSGEQSHVVDVSLVFNDPDLYGLRMCLDGDAAKFLNGLKLDVLYKKISDDLGVYQIEFALPEAMRTLDFGAMSVTMPMLGLELYTNGDFVVDLGFPHQLDFSRSFSFQAIVPPAIPLLGSGGFYFGSISAAAAPDLPTSTRGHFKPVMVFGLGMQVGLGKTFNKGVLSAGFSLTVVGILEGILARWNPNSSDYAITSTDDNKSEYYYRVQGTLGLVGKIYGYVDFTIIKASINIEVYVYVQATCEAYRPMPLALIAGVEVHASLKVNLGLFKVTLHFSFSTRIEEKFVIGDQLRAPWDDQKQLAVTPVVANYLGDYPLQFEVAPPHIKKVLNLMVAPMVSIAGEQAKLLNEQRAVYVLTLFIDTYDPEQPDHTDHSFARFCQELFYWLISSYLSQSRRGVSRTALDATVVSRAELTEIFDKVSSEKGAAFTVEDIVEFFSQHFEIKLSTLNENVTATLFPMLPQLKLHVPEYPGTEEINRSFDEFTPVDDDYAERLEHYFSQLQVIVDKESAEQNTDQSRSMDETVLSMSTKVMQDFVRLAARQLIQSGLDVMRSYEYALRPDESLQDVLSWLTNAGNVVSATQLVESNDDIMLMDRTEIFLPERFYLSLQSDTLQSIIDKHTDLTISALAARNASNQNLIRRGARVELEGFAPYYATSQDDISSIAQHFELTIDEFVSLPAIQDMPGLIGAHGLWVIPPLDVAPHSGDTLASFASRHLIPVARLANQNNLANKNLFARNEDSDPLLSIPNLEYLTIATCLNEMEKRHVIANLSGLVARYPLHGLRLPTATAETRVDASLYELTGQQVDFPQLDKIEQYSAFLKKDSSVDWISFVQDENPDSLEITMNAKDLERVQTLLTAATTTGVQTGLKKLESLPRHQDTPVVLPFQDETRWQADELVPLSHGSSPKEQIQDLRIWPFPKSLINMSLTAISPIYPRADVQVGVPNQHTGQIESKLANGYAFATTADILIRKLPDATASGTDNATYEVLGADEKGTDALRKFLQFWPIYTRDYPVERIAILYQPSVDADVSIGYQSISEDVCLFVTRVNLSNATNPQPDASVKLNLNQASGFTNDTFDFVRILWEASITRSGGCYLYYSSKQSEPGLPEAIFNGDGTAKIKLLLLHGTGTLPKYQLNWIMPWYNATVTADALDDDRALVLANLYRYQGAHSYDWDSLSYIANMHRISIGDLLHDIRSTPLSPGISINLRELVYEVRPEGMEPGQRLEDIAQYFSVNAQDVRALNPTITDFDNIPVFTALILPDITLVTPEEDKVTFEQIATKYNVSYDLLAYSNRDHEDLFESSQYFEFRSGPLRRRASAPPGFSSFIATRIEPDATPEVDSPEYAKVYLDNVYQLLGYRVKDNVGFRQSVSGIPVGPASPGGASKMKLTAPQIRSSNGEWQYHVDAPHNHSARQISTPSSNPDLPDMQENPYASIGHILQLEFEWRDPFGNRTLTALNRPELMPTQPLNSPLLKIGYTDTLLGVSQWPNVATSFAIKRIGDESIAVEVSLSFDSSSYADTQSESTRQRATTDMLMLEKLYYQLNDTTTDGREAVSIGISTSLRQTTDVTLTPMLVAKLRLWVESVYLYLKKIANGISASAPSVHQIAQEISTNDLVTSQLFSLHVELYMSRPIEFVDPAFRQTKEVFNSRTRTQPWLASSEQAQFVSHTTFAEQFESACDFSQGWRWKLATGVESSQTNPNDSALWIVRLGLSKAEGMHISLATEPMFFGVPPLATNLLSQQDVPIFKYQTNHGIDWNEASATPTGFSEIDLDTWARQFLTKFDRVLAPDRVMPIYIVDALIKTEQQTPLLERLRDVKRQLATAISGRVENVLGDQLPIASDLEAARERLRQELLISTGNAYATDVIVQFRATITSEFEGKNAPQVYGVMAPNTDGVSNDVSITPGKISLADSQQDKTSHLTLLISAPGDLIKPNVKLQAEFKITQFEHDIRDVRGIKDYQASAWLKLVRPNDGQQSAAISVNNENVIDVPIPLRSYPMLPTMVEQRYSASNPETEILSETPWWNYSATFQEQQRAPQDDALLKVTFNNPDETGLAKKEGVDLFDALAQFIATDDVIEADLQNSLPGITPNSQSTDVNVTVAHIALVAFIEVAERTATAWSSWAPQLTHANEQSDVFSCRLHETFDDTNPTRFVMEVKDRPEIETEQFSVDIPGWTTQKLEGENLRFVFSDPKDVNHYLSPEQARKITEREPNLCNLHVLRRQNAISSVSIIRNEYLLEKRRSADAFIYQTPAIEFSNPLHPLLVVTKPFNIATEQKHELTHKSLLEHLHTLLLAIYDNSNFTPNDIHLEVSYCYTINPATGEIKIPVLLAPRQSQNTSTDDTLEYAKRLAATILKWNEEQRPTVSDAQLLFEMRIISSPEVSDSALPLLQYDTLFLPIAAISDWS